MESPSTEIYTLSLHDALPISPSLINVSGNLGGGTVNIGGSAHGAGPLPNAKTVTVANGASITADALSNGKDRKSTRLNSSHVEISYAVFCLKKKKNFRSTIRY